MNMEGRSKNTQKKRNVHPWCNGYQNTRPSGMWLWYTTFSASASTSTSCKFNTAFTVCAFYNIQQFTRHYWRNSLQVCSLFLISTKGEIRLILHAYRMIRNIWSVKGEAHLYIKITALTQPDNALDPHTTQNGRSLHYETRHTTKFCNEMHTSAWLIIKRNRPSESFRNKSMPWDHFSQEHRGRRQGRAHFLTVLATFRYFFLF